MDSRLVPKALLHEVEIWLRGALDCKDFHWDSDQHEAADGACKELAQIVAAPPVEGGEANHG